MDIDESKEREEEKALDRAIEQSFPASDPIPPKHITGTEPPGSDIDRKAPKITRQQVEAAANPTGEPPAKALPKEDAALPQAKREQADD